MEPKPWTTIRTFSAQAAESGVPAAGSFVRLKGVGSKPTWVEFLLDGGSVSGGATDVTFIIWTLVNGKVVLAGRISMSAIDAAQQGAASLRLYAEDVYVTVEKFSGGTSPTVSGTLLARKLEVVSAEAEV